MQELQFVKSLHPVWREKIIQALTSEEGVRRNIGVLLDQFYLALEQSIETGDPTVLDAVILAWSTSLTETDLEGHPIQLSHILKEIVLLTQQIYIETLEPDQSLQLMKLLLPCFAHAFQKAAETEVEQYRKATAKEIKLMQETMEKLDKSKSSFISIAAHELKTPLTLIEGYATMLDEIYSVRGENNSSEISLLKGIHNGTNRLKIIIDDMIDVSLIDNNLLTLNFQPVWINQLFSILEEELKNTFIKRDLQYIFQPFPGCDEVLFGEPERLLQVFRNIITNAIKFTPNGGKITVQGRKLPGFIEVTISDTGIGIDPEDHPYIFEKFGRLGNLATHSSGRTKFKGGGPGLGLHIAKGIVETHGGTIWVESPGHDEINNPGSTFHILLPMRTTPPDETMAKLFSQLTNEAP